MSCSLDLSWLHLNRMLLLPRCLVNSWRAHFQMWPGESKYLFTNITFDVNILVRKSSFVDLPLHKNDTERTRISVRNCFLYFAVEHWFGCCTNEPGFAGILALEKFDRLIAWLIDNVICKHPCFPSLISTLITQKFVVGYDWVCKRFKRQNEYICWVSHPASPLVPR